ncbi:MAG: type II toxin-antitoxin system HipA family toxin [Lachnospiraceae bacterium]|nr:type II toxin-antitoxin system HipA family toxin [Lachnospiraceae bacterium]
MDGRTLDVFYKGQSVGTLAETSDRLVAFAYSDSWLRDGFSISPISLPLREGVFVPGAASRDGLHGLFGVFADSLPDSWGELLLLRSLKKQGIHLDSLTTLTRLAYVGNAGMGALEYYPSKASDYSARELDYDEIAKECEQILESKTTEQLDLLFRLGGSSGGTRPKILLSECGRDWIVKFPARSDERSSGRREYDYSLCAKNAGILMTETQLIPSRYCDGYFKTERFDRQEGQKVFTVTFAGILEQNMHALSEYDTLFRVVNVLTREDRTAVEQLFRVMCFNAFAHNYDDHLKNFSMLYDDSRWKLAPAYDLTYSETYFMGHTSAVNGKRNGITAEDLSAVGERWGIKKKRCTELISEVKENAPDLTGMGFGRVRIKPDAAGLGDRLREIK